MKKVNNRSAFTLIELLVVIAIIAILAVVVVLTLNPAELLRQARDSNRVSDMATIKSAESLFEADVATSSATALGVYGTAYVYSGGVTSTAVLTNSTTSAGWAFATSSVLTGGVNLTSSSRVVNGTGWIPTNLSLISSGAPIGSWPVDPVNNSLLSYVFVASGTTFKIDAKMESSKYGYLGTGDVVTGDGGPSTSTYEQGSNLSL